MVLSLLLPCAANAASLAAGYACDEEVCPIPTVNEFNQPVYAIVSPVGYHAVEMIRQSPRLDTLAGKIFAEDEEACRRVGWTPYHVTQGYAWNDNTVTAASALAYGNNVTPATNDPEKIMQLMAFDITEKQQNGLGNTNPQVYRTLLTTEPVAADLKKAYADKGELEDDLIKTARRPLYIRVYANYWANTGSVQSEQYTLEEYYGKLMRDPQEQAAQTDTPEWLKGVVKQKQIWTIAAMNKGETAMLLAGDSARNKFMTAPGGGYVTIQIRLPENWDELVAPLGCEPLSHFEIANEG